MAANESKDIRNVALIGHGQSGKTTLVEALLMKAGVISRMGAVEDGTAVADYDDEEKERKVSIDSAVVHFKWADNEINIVDTPGYPDFIGNVVSSLPAVEAALVAVSAPAGIEVNTRKVWDLAGQRGVGRLILVTKMDGENIDFDKLVASIKETFGAQCVPLFLPVGQGPGFDGVVNALSLPKDVPAGVVGDAAAGHEAIMDAIVQTDDSVMERYLEGKEIKPEELQTLLSKAVAGGQVVPILCCSARKQIGVQEVLNAIVSLVPSPDTIAPRKAVDADKNEELTVAPTVNAPLAGQVFKSVTDPFVGKLSFIRVLAGKM
ncbi:MAG: GTP-binding protein, partial [Planctomycetes bacterium]|nr:GTP-binding protein [Planctomycetota bacterium]